MSRMFGTDGVRGVANTELSPELAYRLGRAAAMVLRSDATRRLAYVGRDTRISGDMLESAVIAGLMTQGFDVVRLGVVPTPAVARLAVFGGAALGVMISASHNPYEFNGIKFFDGEGYKLSDEIEDRIEATVRRLEQGEDIPKPGAIGRVIEDKNVILNYTLYLLDTVRGLNLKDFKIAVDCANGSAFELAPKILTSLGAEVVVIGNVPDGYNINRGIGSTYLRAVSTFTQESGADLGLAFDGDADRLLAVDENGEIVDGDRIMLIIGKYLRKHGKLNRETIVSTVMSNLGFELAIQQEGMKLARTQVGDRYVLEEMIAKGYSIGGEQSGHIILTEHSTTGDGLLTALTLLKAIVEDGRPFSEIAKVMEEYPQVLVNAKVPNSLKHRILENVAIRARIDHLEKKYAGEGRILIRPSGTEPLVRVMIEGSDREMIKKDAKELADWIESTIQPD